MEKSNRLKGEVSGVVQRKRVLPLFITMILLLTVVFMAVPRVSNQGDAYYGKQIYYNHGSDRDPHLGQRPRTFDTGAKTKSRRLLAGSVFDIEDQVS